MNLENFTSFQGRSGRKTFWLSILVLVIVTWVLEFVIFAAFGGSMMNIDQSNPDAAAGAMKAMAIPLTILILLILWPSFAIYTKRWHDRDKSGWWSLIMLVPLIGSIWMIVECGFLRGTEGPNRFGDDPLA